MMIHKTPKIHTKTVLFSKLRSAPLNYWYWWYRVYRVKAFLIFCHRNHPQDRCLIVVTVPSAV